MASPSGALSLKVPENIGWANGGMGVCSDILSGSGAGGSQESQKEPSLNGVTVVEKFRMPLDP